MKYFLLFKINFRKSQVNVSALRNLCAQIAFCSSGLIFTILYSGSSNQNASKQFVWCTHHFSSTTTNKNLTQLVFRVK